MGKILILEEILDKIAKDVKTSYCLFGERNLITTEPKGKIEKYDLIFHEMELQWADMERMASKASLIIPVLFYTGQGEGVETSQISEQYKKNPLFNIIGVNKRPLELHLIDKISSPVIRMIELPYCCAKKGDLAEKMPDPRSFLTDLEERANKINNLQLRRRGEGV